MKQHVRTDTEARRRVRRDFLLTVLVVGIIIVATGVAATALSCWAIHFPS